MQRCAKMKYNNPGHSLPKIFRTQLSRLQKKYGKDFYTFSFNNEPKRHEKCVTISYRICAHESTILPISMKDKYRKCQINRFFVILSQIPFHGCFFPFKGQTLLPIKFILIIARVVFADKEKKGKLVKVFQLIHLRMGV